MEFNGQTTTRCVQTIQQIDYTEYHNICSGAIIKVPWGVVGWVIVILLTLLITYIIITIIRVVNTQIKKMV